MPHTADVNFLHRFHDVYRDIDRSLDVGDRKGFGLASLELRDLSARLRDLIDNTSVADITSHGTQDTTNVDRSR